MKTTTNKRIINQRQDLTFTVDLKELTRILIEGAFTPSIETAKTIKKQLLIDLEELSLVSLEVD